MLSIQNSTRPWRRSGNHYYSLERSKMVNRLTRASPLHFCPLSPPQLLFCHGRLQLAEANFHSFHTSTLSSGHRLSGDTSRSIRRFHNTMGSERNQYKWKYFKKHWDSTEKGREDLIKVEQAVTCATNHEVTRD